MVMVQKHDVNAWGLSCAVQQLDSARSQNKNVPNCELSGKDSMFSFVGAAAS